jgi:hypothetical protein
MYEWEIVAVEEIHEDRNFRVTIKSGSEKKVVYFYHHVKLGQTVKVSMRPANV